MMKKFVVVEFVECPYGHGAQAVVIGGTRVTGAKCCGSWTTIKKMKVAVSEIIEALQNAEEAV